MSSSSEGSREIYPNYSSYICDCCECDCETGASATPGASDYPVRYGDGQILMAETDLSWSGFGMTWGHTRHYVNQLSANDAGVNGNSWLVRQLEYLAFVSESQICVVRSAGASIWFQKVEDEWLAELGVHATLVHSPDDSEFILFIEDTGREFRFHDNDALLPSGFWGKLKAMRGAGGQAAELEYDGSGNLKSWRFHREGRSATFFYSYQEDRIMDIVQVVDGVPLRRADYSYYGVDDERGNPGDLETVEISQWDGAEWQSLRRNHYRYYVTEEDQGDTGFVHGLRYLVGPEAYERMVTDGYPPEEATVEQLRSYADYRFHYDTSKRVTFEAVRGGAYYEEFEYAEATHSEGDGVNHWKWRTTVIRPLGVDSGVVVYSNYLYQTMLKWLISAEGEYDATRYTEESRVHLRLTNAAIAVGVGPDEEDPLLFGINPSGLIYVNHWNTTTFPGHLDHESVKNGSGGGEIKLRSFTWESHGSGSTEIVKKASETVYRSDESGGSQTAVTTYAYTWHEDSFQVASVTTTLPVVPTSENGNNTSDVTSVSCYDRYGRPTWSKDPRGYITLRRYADTADGRLSATVQDVNTSLYDDVPAGWMTPSGGGLNLITDFEYDNLGRLIQQLGPVHEIDDDGAVRQVRTASWTAYQDLRRETATAQGMVWGEFPFLSQRRIGPVEVTRHDRAGRIVDRFRCVPEGDARPGSGDEYPQITWTSWSCHHYDRQGFEIWRRDYHKIPASGAGLRGQNFDETGFGYDLMLRLNRTITPGGTITWQVHDTRSNIIQTWIGRDATGGADANPAGGGVPNNMVLVSENEFDDGESGGNNLLTRTTLYVDEEETRATDYGYDWRGRRISSTGPLGDYRSFTYDNRGNVTRVERRVDHYSGTLRARKDFFFDSRNRLYQEQTHGVTSGGSTSGSLTTDIWRDESGNNIKQRPVNSRVWNKTVYDGAGRVITEYLCFRTSGSENATNSVVGNIVIKQTENEWDAASNLIESRVLERFESAYGTGALVPPGASGPQGRRSTICRWADGIGRPIAAANYGTAAGLAVDRPSLIPVSSDTVPVTLTSYDPSGRVERVRNPLGLENYTAYDARDRVVLLVENVGASDPADMLVTEQAYAPDGGLEILVLKNATTGDQVTRWVYGTTLADSLMASSGLLRAKIYPDNPLSLDPESPGGSDRVSYAYNRQGETTKITDQTGTVREFDYDERGRVTADRVTVVGEDVDEAVRCITTGYDDLDRRTLVTSWEEVEPNPGIDTPVNQVFFNYDNFGQVTADRQEHQGEVEPGTPEVSYWYNAGTGMAGGLINLLRIIYPDSREIAWHYEDLFSPADSYLPRVTRITEPAMEQEFAWYHYLGENRRVKVQYIEPGVALTFETEAGGNIPSDNGPDDPYVGLDRFGRDIDHRWIKGASDLERIQYGYNAGSRRIWRREAVVSAGGQDEAYLYDGLSQVTQRQRGTLNLSATAIGTEVAGEAFDYDPAGNWQEYRAWVGDEIMVQPRTYNEANELRTFDGSGSVVAYDAAGRMTVVPAGENPADGIYRLTWDAWSRLVLVELVADDEVISSRRNEYDGLFRRTRSYPVDDPGDSRDYYYDLNWKVIEERVQSPEGDYTDQYIYGARGRNDTILRDRWPTGSSSLPGGHTRLYALCDAMGSKTAIISAEGAVLERYGYSAFGMSRVMNSDFEGIETSLYDWQVRFHGETRDADTGWYNYGYRFYSPELGRWLSRDLIGEKGGLNLYVFVSNNSINLIDLLGNIQMEVWINSGHSVTAGPDIMTYGTFEWGCLNGNPVFGNLTYKVELKQGWLDKVTLVVGYGASGSVSTMEKPMDCAVGETGSRKRVVITYNVYMDYKMGVGIGQLGISETFPILIGSGRQGYEINCCCDKEELIELNREEVRDVIDTWKNNMKPQPKDPNVDRNGFWPDWLPPEWTPQI